MTFEEQTVFYKELVDKELDKYMTFPEGLKQGKLFEAMKYSLNAGGKRIRPVLALEFCRICGGEYKNALPAACAIEMIHTFSLIHDDLPCMDNDDMRRGRPSCHKAFDEATALLAGDALEMYPFDVLAGSTSCGVSAENALKMVKMLAWASGHMGMIGGQQIDTEFEGQSPGLDELLKMYRLKTSRLLQAAAGMGCLSAGADGDAVGNALEYADRLGLAFQIVDDILDIYGDEKALGKPIGSDKEKNKYTYVTYAGLEGAKEKAKQLTDEALVFLAKFNNSEFLKKLTIELLNRNK